MKTYGCEDVLTPLMRAQLIDDGVLMAEMLHAHDAAMCAYQALLLDGKKIQRKGVRVYALMLKLVEYWVGRRDAAKALITADTDEQYRDLGALCYRIGCSSPGMTGFSIEPDQYTRWLEYNDRMAKEGV